MLCCLPAAHDHAHALLLLSQRLVLCCMLLSQRLVIMLSCFAVVEPAAHASQLSQRLVLCCYEPAGSCLSVESHWLNDIQQSMRPLARQQQSTSRWLNHDSNKVAQTVWLKLKEASEPSSKHKPLAQLKGMSRWLNNSEARNSKEPLTSKVRQLAQRYSKACRWLDNSMRAAGSTTAKHESRWLNNSKARSH